MTRQDRIRVIRRVLNEHVVEDRGYETPCWIWMGATIGGHSGRGKISIREGGKNRFIAVPRLVLWVTGRIDINNSRELACHHCDVPACIRPSHLYVGTKTSNMEDAVARGLYPTGPNHHNWKPEVHL